MICGRSVAIAKALIAPPPVTRADQPPARSGRHPNYQQELPIRVIAVGQAAELPRHGLDDHGAHTLALVLPWRRKLCTAIEQEDLVRLGADPVPGAALPRGAARG